MARPLKQGLDYFPLDVGFYQDKKIRILKAKYGTDGTSIYLYLLCEIYKSGYYITVDDDFIELMADDLRMSANKIKQVLNFLLERSLFDNKLFQSDKVLTSASIQRRFQHAVKERAKKTPIKIKGFWLLKKEETETFIQVCSFLNNSRKNDDNSEKNRSYSQEKPPKVKESKANQSIVERSAGKTAGKTSKALTAPQKEQLIREFGKELTDEYIKRTTAYHCCNYHTIRKWILEDREKKCTRQSTNQFHQFHQREVTQEQMDELEKQVLQQSLDYAEKCLQCNNQ